MKKKICSVLAAALILSALCLGFLCACAEGNSPGSVSSFVLQENASGGYTVTGYTATQTELFDLTIPETVDGKQVTEIADYAFSGQALLRSVTVGSGVRRIGAGAFSGCFNLAFADLPFCGESRSAQGEKALMGYVFGQEPYADSDSVKQYYEEGYYCRYYIPTSLKSVRVDHNLAYGAFSGMTELKRLIVGENVIYVEDGAFEGCDNLHSVYVASPVIAHYASDRNSIGGLFAHAEFVYVAKSVGSVGKYISSLGVEPKELTGYGVEWSAYAGKTYRFEAEEAEYSPYYYRAGNNTGPWIGPNTRTDPLPKPLTFRVQSDFEVDAKLNICLGLSHDEYKTFNEYMIVDVNGERLEVENFDLDIPAEKREPIDNFKNFFVADIRLSPGENVITFSIICEDLAYKQTVDYMALETVENMI